MIIEIKIPTPGESITEVEIASWLVSDGDIVEKDQEIAEIESDKATLMLSAEEGGQISIKAPESEPVKVGSIACTIDTDKAGETSSAPKKEEKAEDKEATSKNEEKLQKLKATNPLKNHLAHQQKLKLLRWLNK
jgi:2-oxoglutarate dehydrogenase E2 component (dihydrolipoamide succinyltransferase)